MLTLAIAIVLAEILVANSIYSYTHFKIEVLTTFNNTSSLVQLSNIHLRLSSSMFAHFMHVVLCALIKHITLQ